MRIAVSVVLLLDLYIRSLSITAFFTNNGVLPLPILKQYNWHPLYFSLHAISGELWWQISLFILNAICIVLLLVGYRARLFTFICWAFLTSLQNRNPFILQGGDDLLRLLLFWAIFLPWGERYSIQKKSTVETNYFSVANIGYILLIFSVFFFSALLKTSPEWRSEGTALYYALSLDQIKLPLGNTIYQYPLLLKVLTFVVFYIELLAPILLILPFFKKTRGVAITLYFCLFLGISLTLYVGLFYVIGMVSLIGLLPSNCMNWFEKHFYQNKTELMIDENQPTNIKLISITKNLFLTCVIYFCLLMNLGSVKNFPFSLHPKILDFGKLFCLEQNWGMFSPSILKDDGWFVYSGYSKDWDYIDIKNNKNKVSYNKPNCLVEEFESDRWRKFQENYIYNNNNFMRPYYCKYLLKKWNKEHPTKTINDLTIFYMKETTLPNYQTKPTTKTAVCNCQDN
jgi:hypothetical protein